MEQKSGRLPLLSLNNEYTYIKSEPKKPNALMSMCLDLTQMQRLPSITKPHRHAPKQSKHKPQSKSTLLNAEKVRVPHSSPRYYSGSMSPPIYIPVPTYTPMHIPMPILTYVPQIQFASPLFTALNSPKTDEPGDKKLKEAKKSVQVKKQKQIMKFKPKSNVNRFRVAGYVVYFTLYFKHYATTFTKLRRDWFTERYIVNDAKIIIESSQNILKSLYDINLHKILTDSKQKSEVQRKGSQSKPKSTNTSQLILFTQLFLEYIAEYMSESEFIKQHHEVFTVGGLNQNFMISNLYLPQEAALLHIHPHGYIRVQQETEILLLMIKVVIKILVYNFLLGLRYSKEWNAKHGKNGGIEDEQLEELWAVARNAGLFLCLVCEQIYQSTLLELRDPDYEFNFDQVAPQFNIACSKMLEEVKRVNQRQASPADTQCRFIKNLQGYGNMAALVSASPELREFKQSVKQMLIEFLSQLYARLKEQEAKVYKFIAQMTLDQKYLITKGRKQQKLQRINKQKKNDPNMQSPEASPNQVYDGEIENSRLFYRNINGKLLHSNLNQPQQQAQNWEGNSYNRELNRSMELNEQANKNRKMRFKLEQAFIDHKLDGHYKLEKLKQRMKNSPRL